MLLNRLSICRIEVYVYLFEIEGFPDQVHNIPLEDSELCYYYSCFNLNLFMQFRIVLGAEPCLMST